MRQKIVISVVVVLAIWGIWATGRTHPREPDPITTSAGQTYAPAMPDAKHDQEVRASRDAAAASQRAAARASFAAGRAPAVMADETSAETSDVQALLRLTSQNATMAAMIKSFSIDDRRITFTVDADYWNPLSDQDKTLIKESLFTGWSGIYNKRHGTPGRPGAQVILSDLAGNQVDSYY
jgi:hypothetical protein